MIAALPMYYAPPDAVQAFWSAVAAELQPAVSQPLPADLTWPEDYVTHWLQPDLLLSQTCGYPLTSHLKGKVQLVGTFAYDVPEADGIDCRSVLISRSQDARQTLADFAGSRLALNATDSQSGYNALRALVARSTATRPFFGATVCTGAHGNSIAAVLDGTADMAAIDCVTFKLWQHANPQLQAQVRVFGHTERYPGLPLITSLGTTPSLLTALREALRQIATAPRFQALREPLLIRGFEVSRLAQYQVCMDMEADARIRGVSAL